MDKPIFSKEFDVTESNLIEVLCPYCEFEVFWKMPFECNEFVGRCIYNAECGNPFYVSVSTREQYKNRSDCENDKEPEKRFVWIQIYKIEGFGLKNKVNVLSATVIE